MGGHGERSHRPLLEALIRRKQMYISILGDSISTFEGWQPKEYRVFYDAHQQKRNDLTSVRDMWWAQVILALKGQLCGNSSYSGSRVSGKGFPAGFSPERIKALSVESTPNLILVYLGLNDFGYGVPIQTFANAYHLMLKQMKRQYPKAHICCASLLETTVRDHPEWVFSNGFPSFSPLEWYNQAIAQACATHNVFFADLRRYAQAYETLDGAHPTAEGHKLLARCWLKALGEMHDIML